LSSRFEDISLTRFTFAPSYTFFAREALGSSRLRLGSASFLSASESFQALLSRNKGSQEKKQ